MLPIVAWFQRLPPLWRWCILVAAPLLGAIVFVNIFSTPTPTTDEWCFTKSIVGLQQFDLHTFEGVKGALRAMPRHFSDHWVVVPFLFYWPVVELANYDSRWFMYVTLIAYAIDALLIWSCVFKRSAWAFPIALLLLCPSHFMEFLWGWQITISFSILFALSGLVVIDRISADQSWRKQGLLLSSGLGICLLGLLSSAGGFFGFPCAVLLLLLKKLTPLSKAVFVAITVLAMVVAYEKLMHGSASKMIVGSQQVWLVLTALGSAIFGMPMALFEFGFDLASATGLVMLLCTGFAVRRAMILGVLPRLALPIAITVFGLLCISAIAAARGVLGNYHLELALLATCGAYGSAFRLWRIDRTVYSSVPFFTLFAILMMCVVGWVNGFTVHGPMHLAYVRGIESYCREYLEHPEAPKPYPPAMSVSANMLLFLSAHHHPVFQDVEGPGDTLPLPQDARIFWNFTEVGPVPSITVDRMRLARLTVVIPEAIGATSVHARIGDEDLVLRKIHPACTSIPEFAELASPQPGFVAFAGMIVPRLIGAGVHTLQLSIVR